MSFSHWHGEVLQLQCSNTPTIAVSLIAEVKGEANISLALPSRPYHRYCISPGGQISVQEGVSKGSVFIIEMCGEGLYRFRSPVKKPSGAEKEHVNNSALYLGVRSDGSVCCATSSTIYSPSYIHITEAGAVCTTFVVAIEAAATLPAETPPPPPLARWQLKRLMNEGYLALEGIVDLDVIDQCQAMLMNQLGTPGSLHAGGTQPGLGKLGGQLSHAPEVQALITARLQSVLEALLGPGEVAGLPPISAKTATLPRNIKGTRKDKRCADAPFPTAQIALRFPEYHAIASGSHPSINTTAWHTDGYRRGKTHEFSLLLGICLTDCLTDFSGNLLVWPESHLLIHKCSKGTLGGIDVNVLRTLLGENLPDVGLETGLPSLGQPLQVKLRRGDAVLLHPETAHEGGPNYSASVRSMIYFRIRSQDVHLHRLAIGNGNYANSVRDDTAYNSEIEKAQLKEKMSNVIADVASESTVDDRYLTNMWEDFKGLAHLLPQQEKVLL